MINALKACKLSFQFHVRNRWRNFNCCDWSISRCHYHNFANISLSNYVEVCFFLSLLIYVYDSTQLNFIVADGKESIKVLWSESEVPFSAIWGEICSKNRERSERFLIKWAWRIEYDGRKSLTWWRSQIIMLLSHLRWCLERQLFIPAMHQLLDTTAPFRQFLFQGKNFHQQCNVINCIYKSLF